MDKKLKRFIIGLCVVMLWFTLISSIIDSFRISFALSDLQEFDSIELSSNLLFYNLTTNLRLEGIQIVVALGFLLVYYGGGRR